MNKTKVSDGFGDHFFSNFSVWSCVVWMNFFDAPFIRNKLVNIKINPCGIYKSAFKSFILYNLPGVAIKSITTATRNMINQTL